MSIGGYTVGELVFLLSLSVEEALAESERFRSCLAQVTADGDLAPAAPAELDPIPTFARWSEVRRARFRVVKGRLEAQVIDLRLAGFTEREVAEQLGISDTTVHRQFRARLDDIIELLGGVVAREDDERTSMVPACMVCAARPRARLAARRRRVRGGWKVLTPERLSSLCRECTPEERRDRLVPAREAVKQDGL